MKNKILIPLALVMLSCLPLSALAVERNFSAGSLIIPMDSFYQPDDDGGILEAYGLAYALLNHTDEAGEHDITVYWVINENKETIDGTDLLIEDLTLTEDEVVAKLYDHAGGTSNLTFKPGDNHQRITYIGAPFIVDGADAETAMAIINQPGWEAVDVHVAQVPFKAPVYREMHGTPPRIALMNNTEDKTGGGNATILESYLRLAGICTDVYDVVTPNEIRDGILTTGNNGESYDFLWAPHWEGYKKYSDDADGNGTPDVEDIVRKIKEFLEDGKGLLAECASIETFEHSQNGRFLTTKGLGHNGGTNNADDIIYNDKSAPNSQVGDFTFEPEGGHLHNWRPFVYGDPYNLSDPPDEAPPNNPEVTVGNPSAYRDTVTRFIIDNTGWDYYVGGYAYGDRNNGYVVYLGGHKYAHCRGTVEVDPEPEAHPLDFEFKRNISDENFTLLIKYNSGSTTTVTFSKGDLTAKAGDPLEVDLSTASVNKKKLLAVTFRNKGVSTITVDSITVSWSGGDSSQVLKKITDTKTDNKLYDDKTGAPSGVELAMAGFTIETSSGGDSAGCTNNDDCSWKNIAGVRYVLNVLFNIKFQIRSHEYVRAAPIVAHPYLYQGTFEYPSYKGHFRRYNVTEDAPVAEWDTATGNHIKDADTRKVYTAQNDDGTWARIDFNAENIGELRGSLNITPGNGDDTDEIQVINRLRGKDWDSKNSKWVERTNKLGGIMHSAPVIVGPNSRTGSSRTEIAYVGDLYGMLHAIETATGDEKWAFIPHNLLGKLKNDRADPNATQDFAAVDASPTAKDIYWDHDNNPETPKEWRTILVCPEGMGGKYIFALDVTDPENMKVLWEVTDPPDPLPDNYTPAPGGGMGHAYRAAINKIRAPVYDENGEPTGEHEAKWVVFVATGYADIAEDHGGINVFAFDLKTGDRLWFFSQEYADSVNDIPGAVTLSATDGDGFVDRVYVGDMNGRLWEINAVNGENPNGIEVIAGVEKEIPLWNAGVGNPISVSPAITVIKNHVVLIFGTGGADWASDDQSYYIYAVDATDKQENPTYDSGAGTLLWEKELGVGEKVWSSPTIAAGHIFIATSFGSMESSDPRADVSVADEKTGNLYNLDLSDGTSNWDTPLEIGKTRGSIYVDRQHIHLTTVSNQLVQVGDNNFSAGNANNVALRTWRQF